MTATEFDALSTPLGFATGALGLSCYPWAERVLLDLDEPGAIACRTANGCGKTSRLGAPAALWNAAVHPGSLSICSAAVFRQVGELIHAVHDHRAKFPRWEFLADEVRTPQRSRIVGFTADKPELFEGFHSDHLLIVLDECKAISDAIYAASLRCQPERMLLLSSPGPCSGFFYNAFGKNRRFFKTHVVTAFDAPHIDRKWIDEIISQFGESHPFTRSAVYAEFMLLDDDCPIPLLIIEKLLANPPEFKEDKTTKAFCDFGGGQAENVLSIRRGNRVVIAAAWREADTMRAVGKFISLFRQHGLKPEDIAGDADGLGGPMIDRMAENGWRISRFHGGQPARKSEAYNNCSAELWFEAKTLFEKRLVIIPGDQALVGQLSSRKGWVNSKGQLCLESKPDMAKRGVASPDRADAVLGALTGMIPGHAPRPFQYEHVGRPRMSSNIENALGCGFGDSLRRRGLLY